MKVAAYYRVSTPGQDKALTIETQVERVEAYCKSRGFEIVAVYKDPALSGTMNLEDRPRGGEMVKAAKQREFEAVVAAELGRITRSKKMAESSRIFDLLHDLGMTLYTVAGMDIDPHTDAGEMGWSLG